MAAEFDYMLPGDRAEKIAMLGRKRKEWIETRRRGLTRFVLLQGLPRFALVVICWDVFYGFHLHVGVASVARVTVFMLLMNPAFNLIEWYWKNRRYRDNVIESKEPKPGAL